MAKKQKFMKHIMTGISYMIPIVVAGGILGALAKAFGGWDIGSAVASAPRIPPATTIGIIKEMPVIMCFMNFCFFAI